MRPAARKKTHLIASACASPLASAHKGSPASDTYGLFVAEHEIGPCLKAEWSLDSSAFISAPPEFFDLFGSCFVSGTGVPDGGERESDSFAASMYLRGAREGRTTRQTEPRVMSQRAPTSRQVPGAVGFCLLQNTSMWMTKKSLVGDYEQRAKYVGQVC